jgi:hypothetical protein
VIFYEKYKIVDDFGKKTVAFLTEMCYNDATQTMLWTWKILKGVFSL